MIRSTFTFSILVFIFHFTQMQAQIYSTYHPVQIDRSSADEGASATDSLHLYARIEYDASGRVLHQQFFGPGAIPGLEVWRKYDAQGELISERSRAQEGHKIREQKYIWKYAAGKPLLRSWTDPEGGTVEEHFVWTPAGHTVRRFEGTVLKSESVFDSAGRKTRYSMPGVNITHHYHYDPHGNLSGDTERNLKGEHTRVYQNYYDGAGHLVRTDAPGGFTTLYTWDALGRPVREVSYDPAGDWMYTLAFRYSR